MRMEESTRGGGVAMVSKRECAHACVLAPVGAVCMCARACWSCVRVWKKGEEGNSGSVVRGSAAVG